MAVSISKHTPVLLSEISVRLLSHFSNRINDNLIFIDPTFGEGKEIIFFLNFQGHYTKEFLKIFPKSCIFSCDRDPLAFNRANQLAKNSKWENRLFPIHCKFSEIDNHIRKHPKFSDNYALPLVDSIIFDIGVSSNQIDDFERDMRMDTACDSTPPIYFEKNPKIIMPHAPAADHRNFIDNYQNNNIKIDNTLPAEVIINTFTIDQLSTIFFKFGDESQSKKISRAICKSREKEYIDTTAKLAKVVVDAVGWSKKKKHPATKVFQALRIYVNDELNELEAGLAGAERLLKPNGFFGCVSFHSLEDRMVKRFLKHSCFGKKWNDNDEASYDDDTVFMPSFLEMTKKAITPLIDEVELNVRSRSAKLRIAERTSNEPVFAPSLANKSRYDLFDIENNVEMQMYQKDVGSRKNIRVERKKTQNREKHDFVFDE